METITVPDDVLKIFLRLNCSNPGRRFAWCENAVGVWCADVGRFVPTHERTIMPDFPWVFVNCQETLINGELPEREWIEL